MSALDADRGLTNSLARRALGVTSLLSLAGSMLGTVAAMRHLVTGIEVALVLTCLLFSAATLAALLVFRGVPLQTVSIASTVFYTVYLCSGSAVAAYEPNPPLHFFVYLLWFFPLLAFNKLVNARGVGKILAKILQGAPFLLVACLSERMLTAFTGDQLLLVGAYCLSYFGYASEFNIVTRYREEYVVARQRSESLQAEAQLLETIPDCFISLDGEMRLTYVNGTACAEFGIERRAALGKNIATGLPGFISEAMLAGIRAAADGAAASTFEAPGRAQDSWYRLRCFPRAGGMSVFFRDISASLAERRKLDEAQETLREQAQLLDHARDAIFVQDLAGRIVYWNEGAERLYGWAAAEVSGRRAADLFPEALDDLSRCVEGVLRDGQWRAELLQRRRDGSRLIVESRAALVRGDDGDARSILVICTDVTKRKAAEERIEQLAFYDVLTELPNRYLLRERLAAALADEPRERSTGALLLVDLDDFSTPNDMLGNDLGDMLLRQAALRVRKCTRSEATVARLGGDEFAVLLLGLSADGQTAGAQAKAAGERIQREFSTPFHLGALEYTVSASVGIALFATESHTVDELLSRADLAIRAAKSAAPNTLAFFDPAMQTLVAARSSLQADLRRALQNQEFELHYQPVVNARGNVLGAEALLRWKHAVRGMVPPNEFIPLAEEAGMIAELGRWVLETACAQLARWALREDTRDLTVAVNVSLREMLDSNFVNLVLDVLAATGADPRRLRLEITESSAMANAEDTIAKMTALRVHHVGFSIDDFGTGYSSLSHLKRLPLDILKVDRSFVSDVLTDPKTASIVRTIIALGRDLDLRVIAEGVETEGQRRFLEAERCDGYQGYLFSPALTAAKFEAFVERASGQPSAA